MNALKVFSFVATSIGVNALASRALCVGARRSLSISGGADDELRRKLKEGTSLNAGEQIWIVDPSTNTPLRAGDRSEMRLQKLCHRATYILLVRPSDGKLFVQKRSTLKDYKPGYWDPTPGGVVGYGESYELNAQRELEEEMGLSSVPLKWCFTFHYKDSDVDCWGDAWEGEWEGRPEDLNVQKEEVDEVECMSVEEIFERAKGEEFTNDSMHALSLWKDWKGGWGGGEGGRKAFVGRK
ncbi:hypothetical protein TrCOL_g2562 [Triparma columacea]|uniref:Nudix hydrolase domain-containing protein n=1 Tax=Triparma columacea TaxID=722753 RepID=A0A9W7GL39_9STRA|nr:hypothetical protein TrCOL_g2562 [Triparma columacea]